MICPVFDPKERKASAKTTSAVTAMLALQAEEEVQSELELWESLEESWEARTRERLPNSASVKGGGGKLDRS